MKRMPHFIITSLDFAPFCGIASNSFHFEGVHISAYRMARKFGGEFNLTVWRIMNAPPIKFRQYFVMMSLQSIVRKALPNRLEVNQLNNAVFQ